VEDMGGGISAVDTSGGTKKEGLTRRLMPASDPSMEPTDTDGTAIGGVSIGFGVRVGDEFVNERLGKGCIIVDGRIGADDVRFEGLFVCKGPLKKRSYGSSDSSPTFGGADSVGSKGPSIIAEVGTLSSS